METKLPTSADLQLAFDIGHSSIGWAVLQTPPEKPQAPSILGCGVVIFGADDCLASKRRDYRRQRRHARSTRQRIQRMEKLLMNFNLVTATQVADKHKQAGGHPAPWLLAARILASNGDSRFLLESPELWDVLRWYAHNRGYDGNARWANASEDALTTAEQDEKKSDTEKVQNAEKLMADYGKHTMAETVFADLFNEFGITDPTNVERLPYFQKRFKAHQCAFPRKTVEAEVLRILQAHRSCDAKFINLLLGRKLSEPDRTYLEGIGITLPKRFEGGLLFGQLVPRFENRIIGECPITREKLPGKHCSEFLEFRWAMTLANIRIGFGEERYKDEARLRPLAVEELGKVDARVRRLGFLKLEPDRPSKDGLVRPGKNELRAIVVEETKCERHNLDALLLHPDSKEALKLLPVKGETTAFRVAWGCFGKPQYDVNGRYYDDPLRRRFTIQLLRGTKEKPRKLTIQRILTELDRLKKFDVSAQLIQAATREVQGKRLKAEPEKLHTFLNAEFHCDKIKGRARFSRNMLKQAVQQVFHKNKSVHPLEKGGCLEQTEDVLRSALDKPIDQQTNNHLVRHRLLILKRLQDHIVQDFAGGDIPRNINSL